MPAKKNVSEYQRLRTMLAGILPAKHAEGVMRQVERAISEGIALREKNLEWLQQDPAQAAPRQTPPAKPSKPKK